MDLHHLSVNTCYRKVSSCVKTPPVTSWQKQNLCGFVKQRISNVFLQRTDLQVISRFGQNRPLK